MFEFSARTRRTFPAMNLVLVLTILVGCKTADPTGPSTAPLIVTIDADAQNRFLPGDVYLLQDGAIIFRFGATGHNVIFDSKPGVPSNIAGPFSGVSVDRIFEFPGTYPFHCDIHPGMSGVVRVIKKPSEGSGGPS